MIFNIEVKNGAVISIDDCTTTTELAARWGQNIPQQWPTKYYDCHIALKTAIQPKTQPDNWYASIVNGGYNYEIADNSKPATEEYLQEIGKKLNYIYSQWEKLVEVPKVLPDGTYSVLG